MKISRNLLITFLAFFLFTNCSSSSSSSEKNYDKMAQELCNCMQPLKDLRDKIQTLSTEGKTQEINDASKEFQQLIGTANTCAEELDKKYAVAEEEKGKAMAAFKKSCPEVAGMMNSF